MGIVGSPTAVTPRPGHRPHPGSPTVACRDTAAARRPPARATARSIGPGTAEGIPSRPGLPRSAGRLPPAQGGYQRRRRGYQRPRRTRAPAAVVLPPPPAYPNQPGYPPSSTSATVGPAADARQQSDERLWATLSHISIPFIGVVGPLIVYPGVQGPQRVPQGSGHRVAELLDPLHHRPGGGLDPDQRHDRDLVLPTELIFIAVLVLCIMAAIAANKGEAYRYPINWRLIK